MTEKLIIKGVIQGKYVMNKFEKKCIIETPDLLDFNVGDEVELEITRVVK